MGADGASGLKQMREQGAFTLAQDEQSSVVWGMPGAAVALGAVQRIVPSRRSPPRCGEGGDHAGQRRGSWKQ